MSTIGMTTARQWAHLFGLGLALAVAIVMIVAVVLPAAALALGLALLVAGATLAAQHVAAAARTARAAVAGAAPAEEAPRPTLQLALADGTLLSARQVPLPGEGEHRMVLTRQGYLVVGADGQVLHRL